MPQREFQYWRYLVEKLPWMVNGGRKRLPFFVGPRVDSSGDGMSPYRPFKTMQEAIDHCEDEAFDVIFRLVGTENVTTPVLFNKKWVTVISVGIDAGGNSYSIGERFNTNHDTDVAAIVSQPSRLVGLGFQGGDATKASLQFALGNGFASNFSHLLRCRFTNWNNAKYAIDTHANDYVCIEECDFDGTINGVTGGANTFDDGIRMQQNHHAKVLKCRFRGCTYAILHAQGDAPNNAPEHWNQEFEYSHNKVLDGLKFLDAGDIGVMTTQKGLIADNWFSTATNATTYSDTVANLQAVFMQFSGNHYKE